MEVVKVLAYLKNVRRLAGNGNTVTGYSLEYANNGRRVTVSSGTMPVGASEERRIYLISEVSGATYATGFTDVAGQCIFENVVPGYYKILIDGNGIPAYPTENYASVVYDRVYVPSSLGKLSVDGAEFSDLSTDIVPVMSKVTFAVVDNQITVSTLINAGSEIFVLPYSGIGYEVSIKYTPLNQSIYGFTTSSAILTNDGTWALVSDGLTSTAQLDATTAPEAFFSSYRTDIKIRDATTKVILSTATVELQLRSRVTV